LIDVEGVELAGAVAIDRIRDMTDEISQLYLVVVRDQ